MQESQRSPQYRSQPKRHLAEAREEVWEGGEEGTGKEGGMYMYMCMCMCIYNYPELV